MIIVSLPVRDQAHTTVSARAAGVKARRVDAAQP
jgi:hypothetical protein